MNQTQDTEHNIIQKKHNVEQNTTPEKQSAKLPNPEKQIVEQL